MIVGIRLGLERYAIFTLPALNNGGKEPFGKVGVNNWVHRQDKLLMAVGR